MPSPSTITASWPGRPLGAAGLAVIIGIILVLGAGVADAEWGVGYTAGNDQVYRFHLVTGEIELVGPMGIGPVDLIAMTWGPDGFLYGLGSSSPSDALYRIDPGTGSATLIGELGLHNTWSGLAFDADGTLWLTSSSSSAGTLYRVDPATAAPTPVHVLGEPISALAFHGDQLYGFSMVRPALLAIDRTTGLLSVAVDVPYWGDIVLGAAFDSAGTLWFGVYWHTLGGFDAVLYFRVSDLVAGEVIPAFGGRLPPEDPRLAFASLAMTPLQSVEIPTLDAAGGVVLAVLLAAGGLWVTVRRNRRVR